MKNKEINNEMGFRIEKALAKQLLIMELITPEQYSKVIEMLLEEYKPLVGSLCEADPKAEHENDINPES